MMTERKRMPQKRKNTSIVPTDISPTELSSQLSLFQLNDRQDENYTQSIEIYDALPKHVSGQTEFENLGDNTILSRQCTIRNETYTVKIRPAIIERTDKQTGQTKTILRYPSEREEMVEAVLRKLAVNGQIQLIQSNTIGAGVVFTLYQLQKELKRTGHSYNLTEIKESITVLAQSNLEIYNESGTISLRSPFFPTQQLVDLKTIKANADARCICQFHPLITQSILELDFRHVNYQRMMTIRSQLARHMFKRMSHYWIQASAENPYTYSLINCLQQSPRGLSARMSENIRAMKNVIQELIDKDVVVRAEQEVSKKGNSIIDVKIKLYPSNSFIRDQKRSNRISKDRRINTNLTGIDVDHVQDDES